MTLTTLYAPSRATWDYASPGATPTPEEGIDASDAARALAEEDDDDMPDPTADLSLIGHCLDGRYDIVESIGVGAFGTVYRGLHRTLRRPVAIKVLSAKIATHPEWVEQFEREAQILARAANRYTSLVYDSGHDPKAGYYIVMEYLVGADLADITEERGPLGVLDFYTVVCQVCEALESAHAVGVVHLDVKSENIFLMRDADDGLEVRLLDFGIAKLLRNGGSERSEFTCGSPYTMSPEAISGKELDARSDIYSLGCVLYEALTGYPPYDAETIQALLYQHLFSAPPSASQEEGANWIPLKLDELLQAMLAKEPRHRPQSAEQTMDDFLALRDMAERSWAGQFLLSSKRPTRLPSTRRVFNLSHDQSMPTVIAHNEVFVVDDDALFRQLVKRKLTAKGFKVFATGKADEALTRFGGHYPGAIVLDLLMPLDGVTAVRLFRASGYQGPIYVLTGLQGTPVADAALQAGADQVFGKDNFGDLATTLETARDIATRKG